MGFNTNYSVGGNLDNLKNIEGGTIDRIKSIDSLPTLDISFPDYIVPKYKQPYTKGFKLDVPALDGVYTISYTATSNLELIDVAIACSGYNTDDYWNLSVNDTVLFETIYTKEIPQHVNMGTTLFTVYQVNIGDIIKLDFYNIGAESKIVWSDFRFLKQV